jgi:hypothetical protein
MNLLAEARSYSFHYTARQFEVPNWAVALILSVLVIACAVAAFITWRATRRKGPPPLPRP